MPDWWRDVGGDVVAIERQVKVVLGANPPGRRGDQVVRRLWSA
ncbi:MAG: hypothetical protein U0361_16535 [Nitrospiraceae bacterium]